MPRPRSMASFGCYAAALVLAGLLALGMQHGMAFYAFIVMGLVLLLGLFAAGIALGASAIKRGEGGAAVAAVALNAVTLLAILRWAAWRGS